MACGICDGIDWNGPEYGKQIECLRCEIKELRGEMKGLNKETSNFGTEIGKSKNILKDYKNSVQSMAVSMKEFTYDTGRQYRLAEKLAVSYKDVALSMGLSVGRARDMSIEFKGAVAEVAKFGGDIDDVKKIYEEFAESSGRVRILGSDEVANIYKLGAAAKLYGSEATNLYESLDLMGISNVKATEQMNELIEDSQKIGLNSSKVIKTLSSNMKSMQSYSFAGGVKGMTNMAKQAVKMRLDVSDVLGMADKFYHPEAAIEAAANLQMLGGDIAEAFGDPFETMYLARNKPEELAKKLGDMTENMMTFNEETGQYDFPAEARMQLKSAGEQLGINVDSMIEMARQTSKIKDAKMELSGSMFSDDEMDAIASMSRIEDGEFKVDFRDENGDKVSKSIDELTKGEAEMLLRTPQGEEEIMEATYNVQEQMLLESRTTNQRLEDMNKSFEFGFVADFDVFKQLETTSKKSLQELSVVVSKSLDGISDRIDGNALGEAFVGAGGSFDTKMSEMITSIGNAMSGDINIDDPESIEFSDIGEILFKNPNVTMDTSNGSGAGAITMEKIMKQWCSARGMSYDDASGNCKAQDLISYPGEKRTVTGSFGEFTLDDRDMLIAGDPKKIGGGANNNTSSEMKVSGSATINVNIKSDNPSLDISSLKDTISRTVTKMFNNSGQPDGASVPQEGGTNVLQS